MYRLKTVIYKYELLNNSYLFTQYLSAYQNDQSNPIFEFLFFIFECTENTYI